MKREMDEYIENCDSPVKITVGGVEWYYQTFYRENGEVYVVRLYDSSGEFLREYKSLGTLTGALKQIVRNQKKKEDEVARGVRESSFKWKKTIRGITKEEMEAVKKTIVIRLAELKGDRSLMEFSEQIELIPGTVQQYISGMSVPSVYALKRIAEKCGVTIDWLIGKE
jgi:transcriptional regulator with XRE-family HTH domain